MNRKIIVIIVVLIALIILFYPKECGNWGTSLEAKYKRCNCIGYASEQLFLGGIPAGGGYYYCYGLCLSDDCKCFQYSKEPPHQLVEISCQ